MVDSPIHQIINEIRKRYANKNVSLSDIRNIESKYNVCSLVNVRNDNCAFLRITSFGCDEVVFEDVVVDLRLIEKFSNSEELMFNINKYLFGQAYGVVLVKSDGSVLDVPIAEPSFNFATLKADNEALRKKVADLENKLAASDLKNGQMSIFDQDD